MEVWQVGSAGPLETLREAALPASEDVVPLVGRDEELGLIVRRWEQSKAGQGQVVLISGEAGIGKSSLVDMLRAQVRGRVDARRHALFALSHEQCPIIPSSRMCSRHYALNAATLPRKLTKLEQPSRPLTCLCMWWCP